MRVSIGALGTLFTGGCMLIDAISPEVRLSDAVHRVNDEVRWGRIDLAAQEVASAHRADFVGHHRNWGRSQHIADADVTNLQMDRDGRALALVTYQWVDERSMELDSTTVRQLWASEGEGFVLTSEEVISGNPDLLPGAQVVSASEAEVVVSASSGDQIAQVEEVPHDPVRTRHRDPQGRLVP